MSFHSQSFTAVTSSTFTVPTYGVLVVVVKGPGQGGQAVDGSSDPSTVGSNPAANTTFNTTVVGTKANGSAPSGGTYNSVKAGSAGGAGASGIGADGVAGNIAVKIYFPGDLTPTASIATVVSAGGAGGVDGSGVNGAAGSDGRIDCYWTDVGSTVIFSATGTLTIPAYTSLTAFIFGSGGGSRGVDSGTGFFHDGSDAGSSSFSFSVVAGGGQGAPTSGHGAATGGDQNITGAGANSTGGVALGGSGAASFKTYALGDLTVGAMVGITIADGGAGGAGTGTPGAAGVKGQAIISYIPIATPRNFSPGIIG